MPTVAREPIDPPGPPPGAGAPRPGRLARGHERVRGRGRGPRGWATGQAAHADRRHRPDHRASPRRSRPSGRGHRERAHRRALVAAMAARGRLEGRHVLLARSDAAAHDLPDALTAAGASVRSSSTYRTVVGPASSRRPLVRALSDPSTRAVLFASGSAVRGALVLAGPGRGPPGGAARRDHRAVDVGVAREAGLIVAGGGRSPRRRRTRWRGAPRGLAA